MGRLTHTVSGSIATVRSPAVAPIESLKVHFSPIQEGTGDPSPSNIRPITGWTGVTGYKSGKNLAHVVGYSASVVNSPNEQRSESNNYGTSLSTINYIGADGSVIITQTQAPATDIKTRYANGFIYIIFDNLEFDRYYDVQFKITDITSNPLNINLNEVALLSPSGYSNSVSEVKNDGTVIFKNALLNRNSTTINRQHFEIRICGLSFTLSNFMIHPADSKYEDFEPYSGEIIPVTFPAGGKNLIDFTVNQDTRGVAVSKENGKLVLNGTATGGDAYCITFIPMHLEPGTYTASSSGFTTGVEFVLTKNGLWFRNATAGTTFTLTEASTVSGYVRVMNGNSVNATVSFMLETGSTASAFEPYTDTAYGGYVDLATGNIVAEWAKISINKTYFGNSKTGPANISYRDFLDTNDLYPKSKTDATNWYKARSEQYSSICKVANPYSETSYGIYIGVVFVSEIATSGHLNMRISDDLYQTLTDSDNVDFVYELATPMLIATLTPQELATFKGYSNFWSNAGDVDVTYQVVESSEMTKERQKIFAGNAPSIHTTSGSVANFEMEPGLNRNLKSCKVGFLPVQEGSGDPFPPINQNGSIVGINNLHNESELSSFKIHFSPIQSGSGDPSPSNIRPITGWTGVTGYKGGKNLYSAGDQTFERMKKVSLGRIFSPGTYTLSLEATSTDTDDSKCDVYLFYGETSSGKSKGFSRDTRDSWTFTVDRVFDSLWMYAAQTWLASEGDTVTFSNIQLEVGSVATSYEAYSAPTSYPITFPGVGKNLVNSVSGNDITLPSGTGYDNYAISNGTVTASGAALFGFKVKCKPSTQYTYSFSTEYVGNGLAVRVYEYDSEPSTIPSASDNMAVNIWNSDHATFTTSSTSQWLAVGAFITTSVGGLGASISEFQLEEGSTATSYEPYTNTLYSGYVDLVSGEVVAEYGSIDLGTLNWTLKNYNDSYWFYSNDINLMKSIPTTSQLGNIICDRFLNVQAADIYYGRTGDNVIGQDSQVKRVRIKSDMYNDDATAFKTAMDGVLLYYELETPTVVTTLTPTQIALATGKSSYWSNADGVTVETVGNVRSINGFSKINTTRCSKNLYHYDENNVKVESLNSGLIRAVYHTGIYGDGRNFVLSAHRKDPNVGSTANINLGYCKNGINYVPDYFITTSEERAPTCKRLTGEEITLVLVSASDAALKSNLQRFDIQIEFGTTPSEYESSNDDIYPIAFPVQSKNLFNGAYVKGVITGNTSSGYTWNNSGTNANSAIIKCNPNTTYTVKKHSSSNRFSIATCSHYPATNDSLNLIIENSTISQYTCTTGNDAEYLIVYVSTGTEQAEPDLMVEVGSTASTYESYDNSVYGGYVDLVTGEVTATYVKSIYDGSSDESWYVAANYSSSGLTRVNINTIVGKSSGNILFNYAKKTSDQSSWNGWMSSANHNMLMYIPNEIDSKVAWLAYLSKRPLEIVYELETPQLVTTLTPTQVQALKGTNNILSDANGIIEVKYWSH